MKLKLLTAAAFAATAAACTPPSQAGAPRAEADSIAQGKYVVEIGGCNDCHTPGFAENGGTTPEEDWLVGVPVGYRGPWGTSYPANLRLKIAETASADEWLEAVKARNGLPPMPWPSLHRMKDEDLRAVYAYIKSLPVKGEAMPAAVPPDQEPKTPYFWFVPISGKPPK